LRKKEGLCTNLYVQTKHGCGEEKKGKTCGERAVVNVEKKRSLGVWCCWQRKFRGKKIVMPLTEKEKQKNSRSHSLQGGGGVKKRREKKKPRLAEQKKDRAGRSRKEDAERKRKGKKT